MPSANLGAELLERIMAKRWEGNVGVGPLREFVGSLSAHKAHKGVFITTSELMNAPAFTLRAA